MQENREEADGDQRAQLHGEYARRGADSNMRYQLSDEAGIVPELRGNIESQELSMGPSVRRNRRRVVPYPTGLSPESGSPESGSLNKVPITRRIWPSLLLSSPICRTTLDARTCEEITRSLEIQSSSRASVYISCV